MINSNQLILIAESDNDDNDSTDDDNVSTDDDNDSTDDDNDSTDDDNVSTDDDNDYENLMTSGLGTSSSIWLTLSEMLNYQTSV